MAKAKKATKARPPENNNMELWNQVCETNPAITKRVNQRGGFTAIDAQSQIKRATELWGPFGNKWGLRSLGFNYIYEQPAGKIVGISLVGEFYYPDGQFPIASDMPYRPNDECFKKLQTDCITKALSRLGFNSDVFEGKFDDSRYVAELSKKYGGEQDKAPVVKQAKPAGTKAVMKTLFDTYSELAKTSGQKVEMGLLEHKIIEEFGKLPTRMESVATVIDRIPVEDVSIPNDGSVSADLDGPEPTIKGLDD